MTNPTASLEARSLSVGSAIGEGPRSDAGETAGAPVQRADLSWVDSIGQAPLGYKIRHPTGAGIGVRLTPLLSESA